MIDYSQFSDVIKPEKVGNLSGLFAERVRRSPDDKSYTRYNSSSKQWESMTWKETAIQVASWQKALKQEGLQTGDRVAIMMRNCPEWIIFEQAALGLGLVIVPLYTNDRADNIGFIVQNAGVKILLIEGKIQWNSLKEEKTWFNNLKKILTLNDINQADESRITPVSKWLQQATADELITSDVPMDSLATIVYTSGTTGRPKGVMLSHNNILSNAFDATHCTNFSTKDEFLSFLPLSHMFERTVGDILVMMVGASVTFARSIDQLAEDLSNIKPTMLVTVPRIFERVYNRIHTQLESKSPVARALFHKTVEVGWYRFEHLQHRVGWHPKLLLWPLLNKLVAQKILAKLGGRLRLAISGGAPLAFEVGKTFIGLGLTITQGYGMTEAAPVVSTNLLHDNKPASVGQAFPSVQVKLGEHDELLVKGPNVMMGYWDNEKATKETIDSEGWLHTGDKARIDGDHIFITGRIKDILVLSNGEKVPPSDIELAITSDPVFEQVIVLGEGKPFLTAIVVLNPENWHALANALNLPEDASSLNQTSVHKVLIERIAKLLAPFPGYAKIFRIFVTLDAWSIEEGLITPTLKLKRNKIEEKYATEIKALYQGH